MKTQILNLQAKTQQFIDLSLSDQSKVLCSLFTFSQGMTLEIFNHFSSVQFLVASLFIFSQGMTVEIFNLFSSIQFLVAFSLIIQIFALKLTIFRQFLLYCFLIYQYFKDF